MCDDSEQDVVEALNLYFKLRDVTLSNPISMNLFKFVLHETPRFSPDKLRDLYKQLGRHRVVKTDVTSKCSKIRKFLPEISLINKALKPQLSFNKAN